MDDLEKQLKRDFRNFLFVVWQHLNLPTPTDIQFDIARYLQKGPRRRIIEAFRGVGKSWITAAYVLWRLYVNPQERIMVVSANKDRADAFALFVKQLINDMPILAHLRPGKGQRDKVNAFDVGPATAHQAPSVRSVGITGQLTGGRATIIIADDVEIPKNSLTQLMRDRLSEMVKEFDAVLSPGGEIIYLGTPQCEMSLYNILPQRGYEVRVWPARYPGPELVARLGDRLAPKIAAKLEELPELAVQCSARGAPTDPKRFDDLDLVEREGSYGRSGFSMQFMLDTAVSDADRYPLKMADLIVMALDPKMAPVSVAWGSGAQQVHNDLPCVGLSGDHIHKPMFISPDFKEYQGVVMAVDPSGRGGDELAYAVVALLNGWLYVLDVKGLKGGYEDANLKTLALTAKKYGANKIVVESNFGDGMFTKLLNPFLAELYPCTTEDIVSSKQKEARIIDTLEPLMNQHRVVVDEALIRRDAENYNGYAEDTANRYQLFVQMTRITKERGALAKDDRLDALSMACAYWVEVMDKDTRKAEAEHKEAMLDAELAKFRTQVFGGKPASNGYVRHLHRR